MDSVSLTRSLVSSPPPEAGFIEDDCLPLRIVDSQIIRDADKFKMDLIGGLERTLQGQVKPSSYYTLLRRTQ